MTKIAKAIRASLIFLLTAVVLFSGLFGCAAQNTGTKGETSPSSETGTASYAAPEGYTLSRMVILSRHNIRSPLSGSGSTLGKMTTHEWTEWSAPTGELTLRGGMQ